MIKEFQQMLDYHIHPNFSIDAEGTVESFCEAAIEKGLRHICFTTHVDTDPYRKEGMVKVGEKKIPTTEDTWIQPYVAAIRDAARSYEHRDLEVCLGVEVDYYPGFHGHLPKSFFRVDWDYVLGAVHLLEHKAISLEEEAVDLFQNHSINELANVYYRTLVKCIESGYFDAVAHIDIYRRYGGNFYDEDIRSIWKNHVSELANAMRNEGVGFEINTSSLRTGLSETMPVRDMVAHLHEEGIDIVTVGSDAHTPRHVGYEVFTALEMLKEIGYEEVTLFRKRKPVGIEIK